jgi:hypothetical protein
VIAYTKKASDPVYKRSRSLFYELSTTVQKYRHNARASTTAQIIIVNPICWGEKRRIQTAAIPAAGRLPDQVRRLYAGP